MHDSSGQVCQLLARHCKVGVVASIVPQRFHYVGIVVVAIPSCCCRMSAAVNSARWRTCTSPDTLFVAPHHPFCHHKNDKPCEIVRKRDDPHDLVVATSLGGHCDQRGNWGRWIQLG